MFDLKTWHRWLGLISAISLVVFSLSGIGLNHSGQLNLSSRVLPASLMKWVYGVEPDRQNIQLAGLQIQRYGNDLKINGAPIGNCQGRIVEAIATADYNTVVCGREVYLLSDGGELIEELSTVAGLTEVIQAVALNMQVENGLILKLNTKTVGLNLDSASASALGPEWDSFNWGVAAELQSEQSQQELITWERFLLDLHAGRVFKSASVWLMDLLAIFLLVMVYSGLVSWYRRYKLMRELDEE